jgi:hypothetical protein
MGRVAGEVDARIAELERARARARACEHIRDSEQDQGQEQDSASARLLADSRFKVHHTEWPTPLTPQYYLAALASEDEMKVKVKQEDFEAALGRLRPSVSEDEMRHYERVQRGFRVGDGDAKANGRVGDGSKGVDGGESDEAEAGQGRGGWVGRKVDVKGKGKARAVLGEDGEHQADH